MLQERQGISARWMAFGEIFSQPSFGSKIPYFPGSKLSLIHICCEVELNRSEGDWWNVPVPFDTDGEYVVEILAEDEAGNQAYIAKMLFVVNTALLCAHVEPVPYYGQLLETEWEAELVAPPLYTCLLYTSLLI